jgi:hypothetical protein
MESIENKLLEIIKKEGHSKQETLTLDEFISKNCSETKFEDDIYFEIFRTLLKFKLKISHKYFISNEVLTFSTSSKFVKRFA